MTMELSKLSSEIGFCHGGVGGNPGNVGDNGSNGGSDIHYDHGNMEGGEPSVSVVSATVPVNTNNRADSKLINQSHGGGRANNNDFDHFDDLELGTSTEDQVGILFIQEKVFSF